MATMSHRPSSGLKFPIFLFALLASTVSPTRRIAAGAKKTLPLPANGSQHVRPRFGRNEKIVFASLTLLPG